MRTDKLMINADPEAIALFKRTLAFRVAAGLTLVFCFVVIAVTAPDSPNSDTSMAPAFVQPSRDSVRNQSEFGRGSDIDAPLTSGVDMHG